MSWLTELERLQKKYQTLQELHQTVSEKIQAFEKDYYEASSHSEKLPFKRKLEETERELEKLEEEMRSLESQRERCSAHMFFEKLMGLDYVEHFECFEEFLDQEKSGIFILHGHAGCGLRLLLKRMLQYVHIRWNQTFPIKLNVRALHKMGYSGSRFPDEFKPQNLWRELAKKLDCRALPEEIVVRIRQKCQGQTVLLVLDEIDQPCNAQAVIEEVWQQLLTQMSLDGVLPPNPLLFLLVVAEEADWMFAEMAVHDRYTPSWRPEIPVKLPPVVHYALQDVDFWLQVLCRDYPMYRKRYTPDLLHGIFGDEQYAPPEQVITGIFTHLCQYEFHEGVFQEWLRI